MPKRFFDDTELLEKISIESGENVKQSILNDMSDEEIEELFAELVARKLKK